MVAAPRGSAPCLRPGGRANRRVAAHEGKPDEALSLLREVIDHGLSPSLGLGIENDSDLRSLHGDPRLDALVAHAKEPVQADGKKQ